MRPTLSSVPSLLSFVCVAMCMLWPHTSDALASKKGPLRMALVIGHNKGDAGLRPLQYAQRDAKRFAGLLQELGRFEKRNIRLMLGPSRKAVRKVLASFKKKLQENNGKGMFLFYYSGHSRTRHFALGNDRWSFRELMRFVRKLPVRLKVVVIDSCYSGSVALAKGAQRNPKDARSKGARRKARMNWPGLTTTLKVKGLAFLASSGEKERSYESVRLRSSYFTSSLLAGLRGAADQSNDGEITLQEAYEYASSQTVAQSLLHGTQLQRPMFAFEKMSGRKSPTLTYLRQAKARIRFQASLYGHCFLFRDGLLVQEFKKRRGRRLVVGVKPAKYELQIRKDGRIGVQQLDLTSTKKLLVRYNQLKWYRVNTKDTYARGGGNSHFGFGLLAEYGPVSQLSLHSFGLSIRWDLQRWLRLGLRYQMATLNPTSQLYFSHELGLPLLLGYTLYFYPMNVWFGVQIEPRLTARLYESGSARSLMNFGLVGGLVAQLDWELVQGWWLRFSMMGGTHLVFSPNGPSWSPALGLGVGFVWQP